MTVIKSPREFTPEEVCIWLVQLGLANVANTFRDNGVDGELLMTLTEEDMKSELGLSTLQARKVRMGRDFSTQIASGGGGSSAENQQLRDENLSLKLKIQDLEEALSRATGQHRPAAPAPLPTPVSAPRPAPMSVPAPAPYAQPPPGKQHTVIKGGAKGAVGGAMLGAIGGAICGDAAQGAKMGAAMGATAGGLNGLNQKHQQKQQQQYHQQPPPPPQQPPQQQYYQQPPPQQQYYQQPPPQQQYYQQPPPQQNQKYYYKQDSDRSLRGLGRRRRSSRGFDLF